MFHPMALSGMKFLLPEETSIRGRIFSGNSACTNLAILCADASSSWQAGHAQPGCDRSRYSSNGACWIGPCQAISIAIQDSHGFVV
jgi:hypothetical protein